jgi:hypothetical protein
MDFAAGVYPSEPTPFPPPLHTVYVHVLIHTGKGGEGGGAGERTREKVHKSG